MTGRAFWWRFLMILYPLQARAIEIDVDVVNTTTRRVFLNETIYLCKIKTPPLSHSWAYECDIEAPSPG